VHAQLSSRVRTLCSAGNSSWFSIINLKKPQTLGACSRKQNGIYFLLTIDLALSAADIKFFISVLDKTIIDDVTLLLSKQLTQALNQQPQYR
jgi:hypothetical protein